MLALALAAVVLPAPPRRGLALRPGDAQGDGEAQAAPRGAGPEDLDAGGGALWTANSEAATVSRLDPTANLVTATVRVGLGPRQLAVGDAFLWVSNLEAGTLQRIDF